MVGGGDPFYLKFWINRPHWSEIADFEPVFARSASAVTSSEKRSIDTDRKSVHYTFSNEPKMIIVHCTLQCGLSAIAELLVSIITTYRHIRKSVYQSL